METRKATEEDYINLQGGEPRTESHETSNKLSYVVHDYGDFQDEPRYVTTRLPIESMGIVSYQMGGVLVDFLVAKVWNLHGGPCESASRKIGNRDGYRKRGLF